MAITKHTQINLLILLTIATLFFCLAIGFDISPFLRGPAPYPPEWRWPYDFVNTLGRIWAPVLAGLFGLVGFLYFDRKNHQGQKLFPFTFLLFALLFALCLQFGVLYFSRSGVGVLLERIITPGINGYFTTALSIHSGGDFLTSFQSSVARLPMRAADHPPFADLFFWIIILLSKYFHVLSPLTAKVVIHHGSVAAIWNHLQPFQKVGALLSCILIPMLSVSIIVPLYFFTKIMFGKEIAVRTSFLYTVVPSLSLFVPLNDVFLGLFVMLGFLFFILGQKKNHPLFFLFSGLLFCIGVFLSVSLLVPVLMLYCFLLLSQDSTRDKIEKGIYTGIGFLLLPLFFFLFFHFDTLLVFIKITSLQAKRSYLPWIFYNLYDFFIFSGIPLFIGSLLAVKREIKEFLTRKKISHVLTVSFFVSLFLLDISGFSRAETGRIWMPYMPLLTVIAAIYFTKEKKLSTAAFTLVLFLQFVQLLVMQEFWVTLW